jgi:hypothetical protein
MKQRYYLCIVSVLLNDQYMEIKEKYNGPDLTFQACIQQVISSSFSWYINYLESGVLWFYLDHTGKFQNISWLGQNFLPFRLFSFQYAEGGVYSSMPLQVKFIIKSEQNIQYININILRQRGEVGESWNYNLTKDYTRILIWMNVDKTRIWKRWWPCGFQGTQKQT